MPHRELRQRRSCECADPGCPACHGSHGRDHEPVKVAARIRLYRIDMEDTSGTDFCTACREDAERSGLFTQGR